MYHNRTGLLLLIALSSLTMSCSKSSELFCKVDEDCFRDEVCVRGQCETPEPGADSGHDVGSGDMDTSGTEDVREGGTDVDSGPDLAPTAAGELDPEFAAGGIQRIALEENFLASDVALLDDGRILVAGHMQGSGSSDFAAARLFSNGLLDQGFGNEGTLTHSVSAYDLGFGLAVIPGTSAFVIGGNSRRFESMDTRMTLVQFHGTGGLHSFPGIDDYHMVAFGSDSVAQALLVDRNHRLLAVGSGRTAEDKLTFALTRLSQRHTDVNFGQSGKRLLDVGGERAEAWDFIEAANGDLIVSGARIVDSREEVVVARLTENGDFVPEFGDGDGYVAFALGTRGALAQAVVEAPDGRIIVGGRATFDGHRKMVLVGLTPTGELDEAFGDAGVVAHAFRPLPASIASIALDGRGNIVAVGELSNGTYTEFAIARFLPDGRVDETFGTNGLVSLSIGEHHSKADAVTIQEDGKIVVAGYGSDSPQDVQGVVVRLR